MYNMLMRKKQMQKKLFEWDKGQGIFRDDTYIISTICRFLWVCVCMKCVSSYTQRMLLISRECWQLLLKESAICFGAQDHFFGTTS